MYGWSEDASATLTSTVDQAQERVGVAGLLGLALLAGVGLIVVFGSRSTKRTKVWKRE